MKPKHKEFILALSYANYLKEKSGTPKVMLEHQQMYCKANISYIGLFSVKKNICHDRYMLFCKFGLIIDGVFQGIYQMSQLINLFLDWCRDGHSLLDIHIHHLLYIKLGLVDELLGTFYDVPIKVYLHDYYNACANYFLLKNGKEFCGGRGLCPETCGDCSSYEKSIRIQKAIHTIYAKYIHRIMFISPSEYTRTVFLNFHPEYKENVLVFPHEIIEKRQAGGLPPLAEEDRLVVAYLGATAPHKGWPTMERLIASANPECYRFVVFNSTDETYPGADKVKVQFSSKNIDAMTQSLRKENVHIAVLWSMAPETYSYTCFEAYAANAMLITRGGSGNVAEAVRRFRCGVVLSSEEALLQLFQEPEELRNMVNAYREQTPGAPERMQKNRKIVELTLKNRPVSTQAGYRKIYKPVNYLLLGLLNKVYSYR